MKKIIITILVLLSVFIVSVPSNTDAVDIPVYLAGKQITMQDKPVMRNNRVLVPIRAISNLFNAKVDWNDESNTAIINDNVYVTIGSKIAIVDGKQVELEVPAVLINDRTYVPLRFVSTALEHYIDWDDTEQAVYIDTDAVLKTVVIPVNGHKITANVVKVFMDNPHVTLKIATGQNAIGMTESLSSMAKRNNAIAAINGTFFRAYESTNPKEPSGNLIIDGRIQHICNRVTPATTFGWTYADKADIATVGMQIQGDFEQVNDPKNAWLYQQGWYVGTINRSPQYWSNNSINLYTPYRGQTTRDYSGGINVVVKDGIIVSKITGNNVTIPQNGFIIHLGGTETRYNNWFNVGDAVSYRDIYKVQTGNADVWQQGVIAGGLGAGPRLLTNGRVTVNPEAENYTIPKITTYSTPRSAIGVTKDNKVLLVTVPGATINELAVVMQKLGAYNAMNIDGGASSGLYFKGSMVTTPGRDLSNALLVIKQ